MKWLVASACLVFMAGAVSAHGGDHSNLPEPGTTPGSPLFGLEQAQESISLALTFNSEKKTQKKINMAQERLSEAKKLSDSNDSTNAEKAVQMHSKAMERAEQAVQNLPEDRRGKASQELNSTRNQSVSVLQDLKQRLPESAMNGIDTAIEAHRQKGPGNVPGEIGPGNQQDRSPQQDQAGNTSSPEIDSEQDITGGGYVARGRVVKDS